MVICREQLKADEEVREKSEVEKKEQRTTMNKHLVGLFGQTKGKRAYEQVWSLRPIYFFKVSWEPLCDFIQEWQSFNEKKCP